MPRTKRLTRVILAARVAATSTTTRSPARTAGAMTRNIEPSAGILQTDASSGAAMATASDSRMPALEASRRVLRRLGGRVLIVGHPIDGQEPQHAFVRGDHAGPGQELDEVGRHPVRAIQRRTKQPRDQHALQGEQPLPNQGQRLPDRAARRMACVGAGPIARRHGGRANASPVQSRRNDQEGARQRVQDSPDQVTPARFLPLRCVLAELTVGVAAAERQGARHAKDQEDGSDRIKKMGGDWGS